MLEKLKSYKNCFENTRLGLGLSFIEIVSNCNSGWKMNPNESNIWMEENMFPYFPLGDIKVKGKLK
jgi:2-oxoglutarate ferredoxin oxidoreductase subunit beta